MAVLRGLRLSSAVLGVIFPSVVSDIIGSRIRVRL